MAICKLTSFKMQYCGVSVEIPRTSPICDCLRNMHLKGFQDVAHAKVVSAEIPNFENITSSSSGLEFGVVRSFSP